MYCLHVCVHSQSVNRVQLFVTSWTVARQALLSTGFPRQKYWHGLSFPPPQDLPDPEIKLASLESPALEGGFLATRPPGRSLFSFKEIQIMITHIFSHANTLSCAFHSFV